VPGSTYQPPSALRINDYTIAFVSPPEAGVILYTVLDVRVEVSFVLFLAVYDFVIGLGTAEVPEGAIA